MLRARQIAPLLGAVALIAGCGSSGPSDKDKIKTTIKTYYGAFAKGDGETACDQLAKSTQEDFSKASGGKPCPKALELAAQQPKVSPFVKALGNPTVTAVKVNGSSATARVRAIGATTTVPLVKEGNAWKIQGALGESD
jgi:hypothetical protein